VVVAHHRLHNRQAETSAVRFGVVVGVNRRLDSSGVRPWPVSETSRRMPPSRALVRTVRVPPWGMASMAFRMRLRKTRVIWFRVGLDGAQAGIERGVRSHPRLGQLRLE